jgi:hypothetical protein
MELMILDIMHTYHSHDLRIILKISKKLVQNLDACLYPSTLHLGDMVSGIYFALISKRFIKLLGVT